MEGDEIILVDYKTDYIARENPQIVLDRYKVQLDIYKRAIENNYNKRVKEYGLYMFAIDEFIKY